MVESMKEQILKNTELILKLSLALNKSVDIIDTLADRIVTLEDVHGQQEIEEEDSRERSEIHERDALESLARVNE